MSAWAAFLFLILLLAGLLGTLVPWESRPGWLRLLPVATALGLLASGLVAGWRWQLTDAYLLSIGLIWTTLGGWLGRRKPSAALHPGRGIKTAGISLGFLALLSSATLLALFPDFQLPAPGGPYPVGTTQMEIVDATRPEILTADPVDWRRLPLQVWYPAEDSPGIEPYPYWKTAPYFLNHLRTIPTHSLPEAPLAADKPAYPVLLFSHGHSLGYPAQNTVLMETLASHGYIVFSIAHPHEALAANYVDGSRAFPNLPRTLGIAREIWASSAYGRPSGNTKTGYGQSDARCVLHGTTPLLDDSLQTWAGDFSQVIDNLEEVNAGLTPPERFHGRLDLDRLGVLGMSFGGSAAGLACQVDERIRAGVSLDGPQFSHSLEFPLDRPFMFLYGEATSGMNDYVFAQAKQEAYSVTVRGAYHGDFADYTVMSPLLKGLRVLGAIPGERMLQVVNDYVLAFFDKHLKGKSAPLLEGPSPKFPEVQIEVKQ